MPSIKFTNIYLTIWDFCGDILEKYATTSPQAQTARLAVLSKASVLRLNLCQGFCNTIGQVTTFFLELPTQPIKGPGREFNPKGRVP